MLFWSSPYILNYFSQYKAICIIFFQHLPQYRFYIHNILESSYNIWENTLWLHALFSNTTSKQLCDGDSPLPNTNRWLGSSLNHLWKDLSCKNPEKNKLQVIFNCANPCWRKFKHLLKSVCFYEMKDNVKPDSVLLCVNNLQHCSKICRQ